MLKDKDIVIFGKLNHCQKFCESNIANNHLIYITRKKKSQDNDVVCSLDKKLSSSSLNKICSKIIDLYKYKNKVFILFA